MSLRLRVHAVTAGMTTEKTDYAERRVSDSYPIDPVPDATGEQQN